MNDRERYVRCCTGQDVDRTPYWLMWGPWMTTWRRWVDEGIEFDTFGAAQSSLDADACPCVVPVSYGPCPIIEREIIAEDEKSVTFIDGWGIKRRDFKHTDSMSEFLEFPVKGWDDWRKFKAQRFDPQHPQRLAGNWLETCKQWAAAGVPIQLGNFPDVTLFGGVRWLMGDEECLMAFYDAPDLVHDIMDHLTDVYLAVFEAVAAAGVPVDVIHIWEDMSGRQGSLISPAHFREFMTPNYARIGDLADRYDIPLMSVDTDGNPDLIVPPMMEGGVNYLWPMEVAAGADVATYQQKYPGLAMMGGVDKRALAIDHDAIDAELERVRPAVEHGRYIPQLDHNIPNDVTWENYKYFARRLRELVGKT